MTELQTVRQPSLYEHEESLIALLDTEAMVSPEQQAEFERDLTEQLQKTVAKRDKVGAFMKHLDSQIAFGAEEIKRIQDRKRLFENVRERLKGYVLDLIESLGPDAKGKMRKLEGEKFTLSLRACPVSLEITDEALIPDEFKKVTITFSLDTWNYVRQVFEESFDQFGEGGEIQTDSISYSVNNAAVKDVLTGPPIPCGQCGAIGMLEGLGGQPVPCDMCHGACSVAPSVPGADLIIGKYSLQVK